MDGDPKIVRDILGPSEMTSGKTPSGIVYVAYQVGPLDALPPAMGLVPMMIGRGGGKTPVESFIALEK